MIILIRPSSQTTLGTVKRPKCCFLKIGDLLIKPKIMTTRDILGGVAWVVQHEFKLGEAHST
jgi:hypothetical protein